MKVRCWFTIKNLTNIMIIYLTIKLKVWKTMSFEKTVQYYQQVDCNSVNYKLALTSPRLTPQLILKLKPVPLKYQQTQISPR